MARTFEELCTDLDNPAYMEAHTPKCGLGDHPLGRHPDEEGPQINGIDVCDDCYYEAWGAEIDEHPIARPRASRGG